MPGGYQVISVGRGGSGQLQQYQALESLGPSLKPDVVLTLFLGFNDLRDDSAELTRRHWDSDLPLIRRRPRWVRLDFDDAPLLLLEGSELNRFVSFRLAVLHSRLRESALPGRAAIPYDYFVYSTEYDEAWEEAWDLKSKLLEKTRVFAAGLDASYFVVSASTPHGVWGKKRGLEMLVDSFPHMADQEWDLDRPDRRLARICRERNIPLLLLEPLFREQFRRTSKPLHWPVDGHWNVEGNRLAGEMITDFVRRNLDP